MVLKKIATENFEIERGSSFYIVENLQADSINKERMYIDLDKIDEFINLLDKARKELK